MTTQDAELSAGSGFVVPAPEAVLDALPVLVLVVDGDGTVLQANAAARAAADLPPVGLTLEECGLAAATRAPVARVGGRADRGEWIGAEGARRLIGWTDTRIGDDHYVVTGVDLTERHRSESAWRSAATTDALTGLPNRTALLEVLTEALNGPSEVLVLFCDLDGFKAINDTHGHAMGDALLKAVAGRLRRGVRNTDSVARLGGDEFVAVCPGMNERQGGRLARRLVANVAQPLVLPVGLVTVGLSVGLAVGAPGSDAAALLEAADGEMYREKSFRSRNGTSAVTLPTELAPALHAVAG